MHTNSNIWANLPRTLVRRRVKLRALRHGLLLDLPTEHISGVQMCADLST